MKLDIDKIIDFGVESRLVFNQECAPNEFRGMFTHHRKALIKFAYLCILNQDQLKLKENSEESGQTIY